MWIGAGRLVLDFYNNEKLSDKKRGLEELSKDLRKQFNLAMLEVADFEQLERCVLGFSTVMPQVWTRQHAEDHIEKICKAIDEQAFARVTGSETELYSLGDF